MVAIAPYLPSRNDAGWRALRRSSDLRYDVKTGAAWRWTDRDICSRVACDAGPRRCLSERSGLGRSLRRLVGDDEGDVEIPGGLHNVAVARLMVKQAIALASGA